MVSLKNMGPIIMQPLTAHQFLNLIWIALCGELALEEALDLS